MASLSNKRNQVRAPSSKDVGLHSPTKENTNTKHSKVGLEILDFHESWLEEMALYKDKLYTQKHNLQMLGIHNRLSNTPTATTAAAAIGAANQSSFGHLEPLISNTIPVISFDTSTAANIIVAKNNNNKTPEKTTTQTNKMKGSSMNSNGLVNGRPAAGAEVAYHKQATHGLKVITNQRFREEVTIPKISVNNPTTTTTAATAATATATAAALGTTGTNKRQNNTTQQSHSNSITHAISNNNKNGHHPQHPHHHHHHHHHHNYNNINNINNNTNNNNNNNINNNNSNGVYTASGCQLPLKPNNKNVKNDENNIGGNSFTTPNLQQTEKAAPKLLTLNGLTKTAANAIETSLYASNYLPQDQKFNATKPLYNDYSNPYGVTFSKVNEDDAKHRFDDDPCTGFGNAASEYSDSESDEEYTGQPFYIDGDESEIKQSRNIRHYKTDSKQSTEDSESERSEYYRPQCILTPSLFPNVPPYLNFSSHAEKGPPMPAVLHKVLKWKLSPVMPKIVKRVVLNSGFRIIKNTTDWMAIWEKHMKSPGFRTIRSHQKYNHMPGSFRIGRKDSMWRSIQTNMKKFGNKEFGFMQRTYVMPEDLETLRAIWPKNAAKLTKWIVKPPASARGTGIRIVNKWSQFPKDRPLIVQRYIERPLLINDNKFDMRIYVVLTSINPLRIYMFKDGLARFASVKYSSELTSLDERCMHLTNYSINKFSQNYAKNEDFNACQGHKWTLQSLWSCLEGQGINTKKLWATLRNLVIKAIITGESGLNRMYRQNVNFRYNCFELFGFDILLDENLIPWLLEINISPSLHSELPLDLHVKGPLIQAVLNTALYQVPPKLSEKQQRDILEELGLKGPLCYDKRVFTTCLTTEEIRKHNQFTNRNIEFREEYLDAILENLQPDDIRCLIMSEDEFARSKPLERIFPTPDTHIYLKFMDNARYYNRLLDAWEHKYGHCREIGIKLLRRYCEEGYHLRVSEAAMEKEPICALTDIDMLHVKKSDDPINIPPPIDKPLPVVISCHDEVISLDQKSRSSKD